MARDALYDIRSVVAIMMGLPITDNLVSIEIESPEQYTVSKSADGSITRAPTLDREYKVKVTLKSSSIHSGEFAALHAADVVATGGSGIGPFSIVDGSGSTVLAGSSCWITKAPTRKFTTNVEDETWEITVCSDPSKMLFGGNSIT
jgi:hypothetical protein